MSTDYLPTGSSEDSTDNANYTLMIATGVYLTEVVRKMDKCFSGLITVTFVSCWLSFVTSLYFLSCIIYSGKSNRIYTFHLILVALLCTLRIFHLIQAEQLLSNRMKKSLRNLYRFKWDTNEFKHQQLKMLQKSLYNQSKSPLTVFSIYSLTNCILIAILVTTTLILILLVQLRGTTLSGEDLDTELNINQTNSFVAEGISTYLKKFLCDRKWYCN